MQQRRYRPGDVLDDYCPRERRITDHAVVAMIDDTVKQTRCCVCDAEHEFKDGKLPAQRRRKGQSALFTQVLEGLQGPHPARLPHPGAEPDLGEIPHVTGSANEPQDAAAFEPLTPEIDALPQTPDEPLSGNGHPPLAAPVMTAGEPETIDYAQPGIDEGPVRRSLIRATLPRPEGQAPPARVIPEFTIRQPNQGRGGRHGRRRGGQMQGHGNQGPMRFGRSGHGNGQGQGHGQGHPHGQRAHGGRNRRRGKKR